MNFIDSINTFIPQGVKEWSYIVIIVVLLISLLCYNKGVLKTRSIIQSYIVENKEKDKVINAQKSLLKAHNIKFNEETGELFENA